MQEAIAAVKDGMSNCSVQQQHFITFQELFWMTKLLAKPPKWEKLAKSIY